jgi:cyclophilin family peptidyl-prolyl cis-trans isomerase
MRILLSALAIVALIGPSCFADEVALLTLRVGKEKRLQTVAIEFYEADAPGTVANFKKLARGGFYKRLAVHRVIPHLLVQVGDPLSRKKDRSQVGTGGPGYTLPPEIRRKHTKGAIAASRLADKINPARMSNGSQFYVCLEAMPNLDGQYTVFGRVLYGLEALDAISTRPVDTNDNPVERVVVQSVRIMPREQLPPPPAPLPAGAKPASRRWWQIFG